MEEDGCLWTFVLWVCISIGRIIDSLCNNAYKNTCCDYSDYVLSCGNV